MKSQLHGMGMISLKVPVLKSEGDAGRFAWQTVAASYRIRFVVCCRLLVHGRHGPSSWVNGIQRCHELSPTWFAASRSGSESQRSKRSKSKA